MRSTVKINARALRRVLEDNFDVIPERSSEHELVIVCPEPGCPDRTGNRAVSLDKQVTNCWRCNKAFGVLAWLRKHGINADAYDLGVEELDSVVEEMLSAVTGAKKTVKEKPVSLPEGFIKISDDPGSQYSRMIAEMAERKHLSYDDLAQADVGYTRVGKWEPFAIFPVYELGRLVYYQGRTYSRHCEKGGSWYQGSTKKFPSKREVPRSSSFWLYNYDAVLKPETKMVVVVESILNVLSLKKALAEVGETSIAPVAVFKHKLSGPQSKKLLLTPAQEICFLYDEDASESSWEEAAIYSAHRLTSVATMPKGVDANDDVRTALEKIIAREPYSPVRHQRVQVLKRAA